MYSGDWRKALSASLYCTTVQTGNSAKLNYFDACAYTLIIDLIHIT